MFNKDVILNFESLQEQIKHLIFLLSLELEDNLIMKKITSSIKEDKENNDLSSKKDSSIITDF